MSTQTDAASAAASPAPRRGYAAVPARVDLAGMDREILAFWAEHDVFHRSLAQREGAPEWTFYEGPPTANGKPGTHHVEARVFKDVFPRFKTMRGYRVDRKAGWDCHGLPVELAVEQELGFTGKGDIEAYGVAEFNARCRESVLRHVDEFAEHHRAHGLLGRHGPGLLDDGRRVRRERLVVAEADLRQGPAGPGPPRHARTARAAAPACPTTSSRRATRTSSTRRSTCGSRSPPARSPSGSPASACWSGRPRRGRWCPTPRSPSSPTPPTRSCACPARTRAGGRRAAGRSPRRCARRSCPRVTRCWPRLTGRDLERTGYAPPVRPGRRSRTPTT